MSQVQLTVLIDGHCLACRRAAAFLTRLDRGRGRLEFKDITSPDFDPAQYATTNEAVAEQIHAVLPDGRLVQGLEAVRRAYCAVGWGWLLAPTGWPLLRRGFDAFYAWFARHRSRFTRRASACASCTPRSGARAW